MHVYDPFARRQRISISLEKAITAVPHTNDDKVTQRRILLTQCCTYTSYSTCINLSASFWAKLSLFTLLFALVRITNNSRGINEKPFPTTAKATVAYHHSRGTASAWISQALHENDISNGEKWNTARLLRIIASWQTRRSSPTLSWHARTHNTYNLRPKLWTKIYFIKKKFQLQMSIVQYKNEATPLNSWGIDIKHQHFQMRYMMLLWLKGLKCYQPKQKYM